MSDSFTPDKRERFRKLLTLASESPYDGERTAALEAAKRLASSLGMDLEEAARACRQDSFEDDPVEQRAREDREADARTRRANQAWMWRTYAAYAYDAAASRMRQQRREEIQKQQEAEEQQRRTERLWRAGNHRSSTRQRPRKDFARALIRETALPLSEIAEITGLSMRNIVELKLKMRPHATAAGE
ncbi:hypothetical protein [Fodinicurvata fenggangensis]|uniref:hypothetical protein n=1 Tax=Fodinicurvata fenggangensis TaxID=1121830 RepID=UPI000478AB4F|nr:hypothetical protein [Fodinicurvata fenggangensis]